MSKENKIVKEDLLHVFGNYYLGNDSRNVIVYKAGIIEKGKREGEEKLDEDGFYTWGRALLSGLYQKYMIDNAKVLDKPETLAGIENFVYKVEEMMALFEKRRDRD